MEATKKIAGEIIFSEEPGKTIKKWREIFGLSQSAVAKQLKISPSVISDYETGKRRIPKIVTIKKIIEAMVKLDEAHAKVIKKYEITSDVIISQKDFSVPMNAKKFVAAISARIVGGKKYAERDLHGYTVLNSLKAITSLTPFDYMKIYSCSSERALIFTGVKYGRSPMIAVRAHPVKPGMVVYHQPEHIDSLATKLAEIEKIPLVVTRLKLHDLLKELNKLGEKKWRE